MAHEKLLEVAVDRIRFKDCMQSIMFIVSSKSRNKCYDNQYVIANFCALMWCLMVDIGAKLNAIIKVYVFNVGAGKAWRCFDLVRDQRKATKLLKMGMLQSGACKLNARLQHNERSV